MRLRGCTLFGPSTELLGLISRTFGTFTEVFKRGCTLPRCAFFRSRARSYWIYLSNVAFSWSRRAMSSLSLSSASCCISFLCCSSSYWWFVSAAANLSLHRSTSSMSWAYCESPTGCRGTASRRFRIWSFSLESSTSLFSKSSMYLEYAFSSICCSR